MSFESPMSEGRLKSMEVLHINHSSIVVESPSGVRVLVDPWLVTPAFGAWIPDPHTTATLGRGLLKPSSFDAIAISHAHDDHLDDFFIQHNRDNKPILVPDIRSRGLSRRLEKFSGTNIVLIGESGVSFGDLKVQALGNTSFTSDDALLVFSDSSDVVIHANDNWRVYDENIIAKLKTAISNAELGTVSFLVQFGIADAFPWFYPNISDELCNELIVKRFAEYELNISKNLASLGLEICYTYANQSRYDESMSRSNPSIKAIREQFLEKNASKFFQLSPATKISSGFGLVKPSSLEDKGESFFEHLLANLNKHAVAYVENKIGSEYPFVFKISSADEPLFDLGFSMVVFSASARVWSEILIGKQTIESITIGGSGYIYKPESWNISDLHKALTSWGYFAQSRLTVDGWSWLC
jgi:hypothetical protein